MDTPAVVSQEPPPDPADMVAYLAAVDLFEMLSYTQLHNVLGTGTVRRLERGEYLFRAGDAPDQIHVLMAGAIEVVRATPDSPEPTPVAYIAPGDAIGDMALFTRNTLRSSGRVPEFADVFTLTAEEFEGLTSTVQGYGHKIAAAFARRLDAFIKDMRRKQRRKELAGKLEFFDLPTVVQTLMQSRQTGVLNIIDGFGRAYAEVLMIEGRVERARCAMAHGPEAFYQIFQTDGRGDFFFRTDERPDHDTISTVEIPMSGMNLLMEAMRLIDELPGVTARLPDPEKGYKASTGVLNWIDHSTEHIAQGVLDRLINPKPIEELVDKLPCSTFTLYRVVAELYESGQIA